MTWLSLGGSLAAVFAVAWLVGRLGLGRAPTLDAATARQVAADAFVGRHFADAVVDVDGRSALVAGPDGEIALVRAHGDKWVTRLLGRDAVRAEGAALIVPPVEAMFGATTLRLPEGEADRWAARLQARHDA